MAVGRTLRFFLLLCVLRKRRGQHMSMARTRLLQKILIYNYLKIKNREARELVSLATNFKRRRRWHVRPIFQQRSVYGAWYALLPVLRETDRDEYFKFMRMTPESFDFILERAAPLLQKHSSRASISPGERLAVTLRYLASGDSLHSLSYLFRISNQAISQIVIETTAVIWFVLCDEVFEPLTSEFWRKKAAEFEAIWQFPMCVGAIDGKHCFVQKFPMRGSEFYNYKGTHSLVLFAVSDAQYKFIVADAGARGRESDGGVFARSQFGKMFKDHTLCLPPPAYNACLQDILPYVFVGDDAFPLHQHLMKPFSGGVMTMPDEETIFNYRLSRARRVVENAFGILSARFRILRRTIIGSETFAQNVILACVALHNLHLSREDSVPPKQRVYLPPGYADTYTTDGILKPGRWRRKETLKTQKVLHRLPLQEFEVCRHSQEPFKIREKFVDLFLSQPVPRQWDLVT